MRRGGGGGDDEEDDDGGGDDDASSEFRAVIMRLALQARNVLRVPFHSTTLFHRRVDH